MNILHISPYFPSTEANHAGGVCMGKEIETLRKHHQVYVLTFAASAFDEKLKKKYENDTRYQSVKINKLTRLLHAAAEPFMPNYFAARSSVRFALRLIRTVKKYKIDAIHAEYASMGQYLWIRRLFPQLKFNLTEHDVTVQSYERKAEDSRGLKRAYMRWQRKLVEKKERVYCQAVNRLFTLNQKDRRLLAERYGREDCMVLNPYYGLEDELLERVIPWKSREYANICFLGQMGRDENYLAAMRLIRIAEKVRSQVPELQVYIVGNQPPEELNQQENEYVHVTGFVEDVDIYLQRAQLAVFPLTLGAGIKLKVLRSLAMGTPVITSAIGAEGIDEAGEVLWLAETDEEFEKKIISCIRDRVLCEERSRISREFVKENFSWQASEKILEQVYGTVSGNYSG